MSPTMPGRSEYDVAVVIPVFKHSVLVGEAIDSALAQEGSHRIAIVIVDDGCPFQETQTVCRAFAFANPNVFYIRKRNGGLSSARNCGVDFVLENMPFAQYLYFLDADNRITPTTLRDVVSFLNRIPEADWVYPNIDKIGVEWSGNFGGSYSRFSHLVWDNLCEAGSLVSRKLLDSGVRFDEQMKAGYEDWDFWLQCLDRGFVGVNYPYFGLEYRQRAESMVRDSNRQRESILEYMRKKHRRLLSASELLALEHHEAPRFACVYIDRLLVSHFTDPRAPSHTETMEEFSSAYWKSTIEPDTYGTPPFICWIAEQDLLCLREAGIVNSIFLEAERLCGRHNFVRLHVVRTSQEYGLDAGSSVHELADDAIAPCAWFTRIDILRACVDDPMDSWVRSIGSKHPQPSVAYLTARVPEYALAEMDRSSAATERLLSTLNKLKQFGRGLDKRRWNWRDKALPGRDKYYMELRRQLGGEPITNRMKSDSKIDVGFILPIASFGGVEKVAYNVAKVLKLHGMRNHLYIVGSSTYTEFREFRHVFDSITFLGDYPLWSDGARYMGHTLAMPGDASAQVQRVVGALAGLNVLVHAHVAPFSAALGELRRSGMKIVGHFHVLDEARFGREVGHPYIGLAYEHVYDLMLACSHGLRDFLHSMGVPEAKLLTIPNAPSYELPTTTIQSILKRRRSRPAGAPLRVLYLGRLDQQKGVERLYEIVRRGRHLALPIEWRVVGGRVIRTGEASGWEERFAELGVSVEGATYNESELANILANADVMILPSRWEGAPLSILESQRLGCIPVATDVGAVRELIKDGIDGFLVHSANENRLVEDAVNVLANLGSNCDLRWKVSASAASRARHRSWSVAVSPLVSAINSWFGELNAITRDKH